MAVITICNDFGAQKFALRGIFSGTVTVCKATWGWGPFYHCNHRSCAGGRTQQLPGRGQVRASNFCPCWTPGQGGAPEKGFQGVVSYFHLHFWKCMWWSRKWPKKEIAANPGGNASNGCLCLLFTRQFSDEKKCVGVERKAGKKLHRYYSKGFHGIGLWCLSL